MNVAIYFNKIQGAKIATVNIDGTSEKSLIIPLRSLIQDSNGNTMIWLASDKGGNLRRYINKSDYRRICEEIKRIGKERGRTKEMQELYNSAMPVMGRIFPSKENDEQRTVF